MDESDGRRLKASEDSGSQAEPYVPKDLDYKQLQTDLKSDAQNLEAESWSLAVDQNYLKSLNKEAIERQDAIYELIQTEMHHVRTLKTLVHVYMYELKQSLLVDEASMERLFPGLEVLLSLHQHFLNSLKMRQKRSQEEGSSNNYCIRQLGDVVTTQFSGSLGEQMMESYSYFCSHHNEAVSFYKEQLVNNKNLQPVFKKIDQASVVRRLGIPEHFLLVTQRITKYPFLLERIIKNTEADTEEHRSLLRGLELIKDTLSKVDTRVREYQNAFRLREICLRLEPKSQVRMNDDQVFRRDDLIHGNRSLLHEGVVTWKSSGKLKNVIAVLMSDMLVFLQEKDQKLVFASMEYKPPVISLQGVIVREVAHEDKGLYIICAYTVGRAEMYEIYAGSKEERNTWMTLIRDAVVNCLEKEQYHKVIARLQQYQDLLQKRDELIKQNLTEKQQIFDSLYEEVVGQDAPHRGLLLRGDSTDLQLGEALLSGAIEDVEILQNLFFMRIRDSNLPAEETQMVQGGTVRRAQTFAGREDSPNVKYGNAAETPDRGVDISSYSRLNSCEHLLKRMSLSESLEQSADDETGIRPASRGCSTPGLFPDKEVCDHLLKLSKKLRSLEAVIAQQDSRLELQKAFQTKSKQPARSYNNVLLEQEKQRTLKKQQEEMAVLQRHQDEVQRWENERNRQRLQMEAQEAELKQREEECRRREKKLDEEDTELKKQWETCQQNLERLRETSKKIDKDKELLRKEKERLEKLKSGPFRNYDDPALLPYPSFRGSVVNGGGTLRAPATTRVPPGNFSDPKEIPPRVPPRRESVLQKERVPRVSTTLPGQRTKVVQQIPRELASTSRRRDKSFKGNRAHKRAHSAANIDVSQVVPIRVTGKEGGSLKTTRNVSPHRSLTSDTFRPPAPTQNVKPSQFNANRRDSSEGPPSPPPPPLPPFPKELKKKEEKMVMV